MTSVKIVCFHGRGQDPIIFKSLLKSLQNNLKTCEWFYITGKYSIDDGYGWYSSKKDEKDRIKDIEELKDIVSNNILLGFSEGACFALDLAQFYPVKGVIALSPSYLSNICSGVMTENPIILITSINDLKISKQYAKKWRKYIKEKEHNLVEISHTKGHKIYLPKETRDIIIKTFNLLP